MVELRQELEEVERDIERTDALIDQIVYRLHRLAEEEIAILEGEPMNEFGRNHYLLHMARSAVGQDILFACGGAIHA